MSDEKLLDKIKKLITLANDAGATEAEADTAMSMANRLLLMHNLTMADVKLKPDAKFERKDGAIIIGEGHHEGSWEDALMAVLCQFNMCSSIIHRTKGLRRAGITIIGAKANVEIVLYLFDSARNMYRGLASKRYSEYSKAIVNLFKPHGYDRKSLYKLTHNDLYSNGNKDRVLERRGVWRPQYLKGCVCGLQNKLQAQKDEMMQQEYAGGMELMLVDNMKELEEFVKMEFDNLKQGKSRQMPTRKQAFSKGVRDARETELVQGLGDFTPSEKIA